MAQQPQPLQALPGLEPMPGAQGNIPDQPPARAGFGGARPIPGLEPLPGTQGANVQDALRPLPEAGLTPLPGTEAKPESEGSWYSRAWDAANTPLTTTLFGWNSHREGATGFEKGLEDFASGFTSPLSVALLVGTLGSSSLFEAGGSAALRAAGMGAEEIAQATRGTQIISKAVQAGRNSAEALQAAGISPNVMSKAVSALRAAGLSSENMATHGLFGGGMSSGLRAMGVGIAEADKVGKGIQLAVDMGFKAQGAYQAIQESPRLLDALKDAGDAEARGDHEAAAQSYATARELFVHVLGGGLQAGLGGRKFLKDAGSSIEDIQEKFGMKVKMSVENQKLRDNYGTYQADKTRAQQAGKIISDELRTKYDKLSPVDREGVFYLIQANGSKELIAKRLNMLAEAAGRDDAKVPEVADPPAPGPEQLPVMKVFHGTSGEGPSNITDLDGTKFAKVRGVAGIGTYVSPDPETASQYVANNVGGKVIAGVLKPNMRLLNATQPLPLDIARTLGDAFKSIAKQAAPGEDAATAFERYSAETAAAQGKPFAPKSLTDPTLTYIEMIDATRRMLGDAGQDVRKGLIKFQSAIGRDYDGVSNVYTDRQVFNIFPKEVTGRNIEELVKSATPTKAITADEAKLWNSNGEAAEFERQLRYRQLATEQRLKDTKNYSPKEMDRLLDAYKRAYNATPDMHLLAKDLGGRFAESLEKAQQKDVIKQGVLDYVTQIWGKDKDHPAANTLVHDANNGMFQTNVSMARHRMFDSAFEGQLLGRKLQVTDPITLVGNHISKVGSAIAARDFMERLVDKNVRTSDGRPMVALAGHGQLVEGEEGENPAVLANPDRIRNIRIASDRIKKLEKSGDLDRLIEEGKIIAYPATPQSIIKGSGLVYKGELTPGSGVHQFEHPAYPGKTAAIGGKRGITAATVADKLRETLGGFGSALPALKEAKDEHYFWNTHDYQTIDHSAFHDWNFGAQAPDGTPVMIKSELRVHPEAYKYLKQLIGDEEKRNPITEAALKVGGEAKHLTLSLSPFHIFQEGLRAIMTGVNPLGIEKWDLRNDPGLYRLVRAGMTLGKDHASIQDFAEGNVASGKSAILSKIPIARDIQNWMQTFLFDKYIPGLKVRAGKALYDRYTTAAQDSNGVFKEGWNADRIARTAAADTNERFGGINYKQLGRSASTQDFLRLTTLAPDWLESEVRFAQRTFAGGPEGSVARKDLVRMAAGLWITARVLNYLTSGQPHNEAPFGVALKDKDGHEKVYSIRTMPTDMLHMMHDPVDFLRGRISPLGKMAVEGVTGRDRMGRKLTPFQQVVDVTRGNLPIPAQLIGQAATGELPSGMTNLDQVVKASGFTATPYKTEAQKTAIQLASNRSESGPVDSAQLGRHQAKIEFEDRLRAGRMKPEEVHQMVEDGHLSVKEGKEIIKNAGETAGMDADMAALYSRSLHLPMKDFLQVWDAATPNEKAVLSKLMVKKKISFFKSAHNNMAPEERKTDPTYRRLRSMFPNEAPW